MKLLSGVKWALSSVPSSWGPSSRSGDNRSQDSPRSSSFVPSPHGTVGLSHYIAHDDVPKTTNGDDISIRTTKEMEKYESLHHWEFAHTYIYDVNLLERVGLDKELPTILWTIGWRKLYDELRLGLRLLTHHSSSMMYGCKAIWLPNPGLWLYSSKSLTLQFDQMREVCHSFIGPPRNRGWAHMEAA
jgi:hypothetical protein